MRDLGYGLTNSGGLLAILAGLAGVVTLGSTVPVLPTGAAVSATAVVAAHRGMPDLLAVVLTGGVAAYCGDAATYAICRAGGPALARRLRLTRRPVRLAETVRARLLARPATALLISRLVPAGRIPVLLAAAVLGLGWRCTRRSGYSGDARSRSPGRAWSRRWPPLPDSAGSAG